jgi:hypothetical protein
MNQPASDPHRRPLSLKEIVPALGLTLVMLAGFALAQLNSTWLGLLILAPVFIYVLVVVWRAPREQRARWAAALEEHERRPFGRVMRIIQFGALVLLAVGAARWLYFR